MGRASPRTCKPLGGKAGEASRRLVACRRGATASPSCSPSAVLKSTAQPCRKRYRLLFTTVRKTCKSPARKEPSQGQVRKRAAGGCRTHVPVPRRISGDTLHRTHLPALTHQDTTRRHFWKLTWALQTLGDMRSCPRLPSHSRISLPSLSSSSSYTGKKVC